VDNKESSDIVAHAAQTSKRRCSVRLKTDISDTVPSSEEVKVHTGVTVATQLSEDASLEVNAKSCICSYTTPAITICLVLSSPEHDPTRLAMT
jgi:hypothetical protein